MSIVISVIFIIRLLLLMEFQYFGIIPVFLFLWVQIMEYLTVCAGECSVKYLFQKFPMALICLCDICHSVCVTLDKLLISVFSSSGHEHYLLSGLCLDIYTVPVLVFALSASALEVIEQSIAITVQYIQFGRGA